MTGVAYTVQCFYNQGFSNYKILTLHLKDGVVTAVERSDPYQQFEAQGKLTIKEEAIFDRLRASWLDGKIWALPKEAQ